jgi:hypothetical protein
LWHEADDLQGEHERVHALLKLEKEMNASKRKQQNVPESEDSESKLDDSSASGEEDGNISVADTGVNGPPLPVVDLPVLGDPAVMHEGDISLEGSLDEGQLAGGYWSS